MLKITEAEARGILMELGMLGTITPEVVAAAITGQLEVANDLLKKQFIKGLGANPVPEAIARASALADVRAKGMLLDFAKSELDRIGGIIAGGLKEGLHPSAIARQIRDSIGLDAARAGQVDKLRKALLAQGLDSAAIEEQVSKLTDKLIRDRADVIARTETRRAVADADLANAIADGDQFKAWMTSGDDRVSDECQANEAEGWIPIGDTFASGDMNVPQHPNCRCNVVTRAAEPSSYAINDAAARVEKTANAKAEAAAMAES